MTLNTYRHAFDELDGADRESAEERIAEARQFLDEGEVQTRK